MSNWPLQFVEDLEDFDFVVFLLGTVVVFFSAGFAIDYIVGRHGMGPYWNGFYAALGAYAGLCAQLVASTLRCLRPLFDDPRGRRGIVGDGCHGERGRQTLIRRLEALRWRRTEGGTAGSAANCRWPGRGAQALSETVASRDLFCNCALHNLFGVGKGDAGRTHA